MFKAHFAPSARFVFRSEQHRSPSVQAELEARFFKALHLPNGTYKTTGSGRLSAVDSAFRGVVGERRPLDLLDVGVSSGVTTLDWLESLADSGIPASITATDLCLFASLQRRAGVDLLADSRGRILQIAVGSRGICRPYRADGNLLPRFATMVFAMAERLAGQPDDATDRLPLVTAGVLGTTAVKLAEVDIAQLPLEWKARFDGVRAANILHRNYFTEAELQRLAGNLIDCLRPGGVLVIGRTNDEGENHFSLLQRQAGGGTQLVARVGDGADIEYLLLGSVRGM